MRYAESRPCAALRSRRTVTIGVMLAVVAASFTFTQRPAKAAGLTALGPVNPKVLIPTFYTDASGTSLQPCLDGLPLCPGTAADLLNPAGVDFVSSRVGNYEHNPKWGLLIDQLWVK